MLQAAVVVLLVAGAVLALVLQSRYNTDRDARSRSVAVAQTFANSPGLLQAVESPDPSKVLQPITEKTRRKAGVDFIVVMNTEGIRYTHPQPGRIGERFVGTIGPSLEGKTLVESVNGPLGHEVQAVVPVTDSDGRVVALVSAGMKTESVSGVVNRRLPLILATGVVALALATAGTALVTRRLRRQTHGLDPVEMTRMYEHHDAVLHAVREGVLIVDGDARLLLANDEAERLLDLPPDAEGRRVADLPGLDPGMAELLASGRAATDEVLLAGDRLLAVNQRPTDRNGGPTGTVTTIRDSTELRALSGRAETARERLRLLYDAGVGIGTTLDVTRTAEELAEVAVPRFADFVTVDLADPVLNGDEPGDGAEGMRRAALSGIRADHPLYPLGRLIDFVPSTPQARVFAGGRPELVTDLSGSSGWYAQDPDRASRMLDYGVHSLITAPIQARGVVLGVANFWRSQESGAFDEEDLSLAEELVTRAAVSIDNARRYTREHALAVTLQRSLLPHALPEQDALEVAHRYLPAQSGVSGDWFDVIPLPGARVALVVGDVVGHGLHAAATMGRLRTAVHNFSTLDLPPDEILGHLDDLVGRIDQDESGPHGDAGIIGATCLYAIYDPVSRRCSVARAGHPPPALLRPDGGVEFLDLPAGPPLGLGGHAVRDGRVRPGRGQPARALHRRPDRGPHPRLRRRHGDAAPGPRRLRPDTGGELPRGARRAPARPPEGRRGAAHRQDQGAGRGPGRRLGRARRSGRGRRDARRRLREAGRVGAVGSGLRHGTGVQRADHQRHPLRLRADQGAAAARPQPRLRGRRRQQHLAPPAVRGDDGRGRPGTVPRRPDSRTLGHPLHPRGQGHLGRAAAARPRGGPGRPGAVRRRRGGGRTAVARRTEPGAGPAGRTAAARPPPPATSRPARAAGPFGPRARSGRA